LLRRDWEELTKRYEAIVIDTPPTASHLVEEFAPKVSTVVVPLLPSGLELDVLQTMLPLLPKDRLHLVLNRSDATRVARDTREALEGLKLPLTVVRDLVAFRDAVSYGGTVLSRYPHGPAAEDIRTLGQKVWS
jgi:cellulose biosynthesis protein BcsQ